MPTYQYVAVDQKGAKRKGKIEAPDTSRAERTLKLEGLIPIQVKETMFADNVSLGGKSVKPRTMAVFCRQMVSLLNAGVSIVDAFGMLADQCDNKIMQAALRDVMSNVAKGENLARSLKEHPNVFSPMMVNMVDAGEASGSLENSFDRLAIQFEKDARLKATIKKALVYPIMVLIVAVAVVIVMLNVVIPNFSEMFKDLDTELPGLTKAVVAMSDWMRDNWIILIAVVVIIVIAWRVFASSPTGQVVIGRATMKAPLIGPVITKSAAARFARTMSTLLSAGINTLVLMLVR